VIALRRVRLQSLLAQTGGESLFSISEPEAEVIVETSRLSSRRKTMEIERITPEQAQKLLESNTGYIYLDVRTEQEFDAGHVPGAKNIPVMEPGAHGMELNSQFVKIVEKNFGKNVKCITGCQKGGRSLKAAELLISAGFTNVVDMRGGFGGETDPSGRITFPGWAPRGLPVSRDSTPEDRYAHLSKQ
jgi:rhodanese-related sulfurtransferase